MTGLRRFGGHGAADESRRARPGPAARNQTMGGPWLTSW
jgi:hypothetical protein